MKKVIRQGPLVIHNRLKSNCHSQGKRSMRKCSKCATHQLKPYVHTWIVKCSHISDSHSPWAAPHMNRILTTLRPTVQSHPAQLSRDFPPRLDMEMVWWHRSTFSWNGMPNGITIIPMTKFRSIMGYIAHSGLLLVLRYIAALRCTHE